MSLLPDPGMDRYFTGFDPAERRQRPNRKWCQYPDDVMPAWIAEHDFLQPEVVRDAIIATAQIGDLGYHLRESELADAFVAWASRRYDWTPEAGLIQPCVDALSGVTIAVTALAAPGETVVLTSPIYDVFLRVCPESGRAERYCALRHDADAGWVLDFDGLEQMCRGGGESAPRVLLWSNPHNPTGWVPNREVLTQLVELAHTYDFYIVSDEIHADMVFAPNKFVPMLTIPGAAERVVTVTSPAKTFAMSGLRCSVMVFGDEALRDRVMGAHPPLLLGHASRGGIDASIAAWTEPEAEAWADELVVRLTMLRDHLAHRLTAEAPQIGFASPQSTYLAWLDLRECGLGDSPGKVLLDKGRLATKDGPTFGAGGEGHVRLNFGTPLPTLDDAITRLISVI